MVTSIFRRTAAAALSRNEAAILSSSNKNSNSCVSSEKLPRRDDLFDPDRFLLRQSLSLRDYYPETELTHLRSLYAKEIAMLKEFIERRAFRKGRWHIQRFSIDRGEHLETILRRMWSLKSKCLMLEIHVTISYMKANYSIVFLAVTDLLAKHHWSEEWADVMTGPLTLRVSSAMEYAKYIDSCQNQASTSPQNS